MSIETELQKVPHFKIQSSILILRGGTLSNLGRPKGGGIWTRKNMHFCVEFNWGKYLDHIFLLDIDLSLLRKLYDWPYIWFDFFPP